MHLQVSTKSHKDKVYKYARIVQSVRDENGKSTQRIIKNIGRLSDELIDAFRTAVRAVNENREVVVAPELGELLGTIIANRRYLDLAVLRECWQQWGLSELLNELDPSKQSLLTLADVVLPLVLQRCVEPGSKLQAVQWFETTALPELFAIDPKHFNNTRVHRALEQLHEIEQPLQDSLIRRYQRQGEFVSLFMDVTDTHFEGMGPELAEQTRTKKDIPNKRCLSIALLANQHGFPIQWHTMGGKATDWINMRELISSLRERDWLEETPLVMDRAMGNPANVTWLKSEGIHFITAAHVNSIETYTSQLQTEYLHSVEVADSDPLDDDGEAGRVYQDNIKRAAQAARDAGLTEIHEQLFVVDLGVQQVACEIESQEPIKRRRRRGALAAQLRRAREFKREIEEEGLTQKQIGERHGLSTGRVGQLLMLTRLCDRAQQRILEADVNLRLNEKQAYALRKLDDEQQVAAIEDAIIEDGDVSEPAKDEEPNTKLGKLAMAAYFNPRLFVDVRMRTARHCRELEERVQELNEELRNAKRSRKRDATYNKLSRDLRRYGYLDLFDIELEPLTLTSPSGCKVRSFQFKLARREEQWRNRRKHDGYVLLLAHPDIKRSATELVELYRAKDAIEKDFQVIKSIVKLRPLFHYTDVKVQAHITICMLALLLERTLRKNLRDAGLPMSASECITHLRTAHLNERLVDERRFFDLTRITPKQHQILQALQLEHLADQETLQQTITPRSG